MKVLLYFEKQGAIKQSGIGRALTHQKKALELKNIDYTLDPKDEPYDFAHINTYFNDELLECARKRVLKLLRMVIQQKKISDILLDYGDLLHHSIII